MKKSISPKNDFTTTNAKNGNIMKIKIALASLLFIGLTNCGPALEKESNNSNNIQTCDAQCQSETTLLKASYVSGHLGNYGDCPQDGWSEQQAPGDSSQGAPIQGDCAEDQCGILNCEGASVILRLSNGGNNDALGILIQKIELKNEAGDTVALLPLESVTLVDNNQQFSGKVTIDETPSIRIDFQGPANPYQLLSSSNEGDRFASPAGFLHITLTADNADDVIVISPDVTVIPSIDT